MASLAFGHGDAKPRATATKRKVVYCTRHRHPKGCVRVPAAAKRPRKVDQQGSNALTPRDVENGGGLGGGPGDHRDTALEWARSQLGLKLWRWRCERFVEEAYGTRFVFDTALKAESQLELHTGPITNAPAGTLVYFGGDAYNQGWGHVGVSLGGGRMISALTKVETTNVAKSPYWRNLYRGWADAPAQWPGRIPAPPGPTTPDPTLSVRITAPAQGSTQSGTVALLASASGASGVEFDAYYATDQRNPSSRGWHTLGTAVQSDGSWQLTWSTVGIPDQGFGDWGTVNLAAIALDARGQRTGTRDYRRISIDNTTGSHLPPVVTTGGGTPPDTTVTFPETTGGAANTWTNYTNAGGTQGPTIASNQTVQIACKIQGFQVADGNTWWYRIAQSPWSNSFYVSADAFYNNGATSGSLHGTPFVDPNVTNCA